MLAGAWTDYAKLCTLFTTCLHRLKIVREIVESSAAFALQSLDLIIAGNYLTS